MQIRVMAGTIHSKYADVLFKGLVHASDFRCTGENFVFLGKEYNVPATVEERLAKVVERQLSPSVQRLVDSTADIENASASQHDSSESNLEGVRLRRCSIYVVFLYIGKHASVSNESCSPLHCFIEETTSSSDPAAPVTATAQPPSSTTSAQGALRQLRSHADATC